jgi:GTP-binding protein
MNSDEPDFTEPGRLLFAGACEFVFGSAKTGDLPPDDLPEIAFVGRSNVGKSSLLNALTFRKSLARVSRTPGRTQQLNFFELASPPRLRLVDMPGYGFAAVGKEKTASWPILIRDYLRGRAKLLRVFTLVDGRRGVGKLDEEMFELLDKSAVSYQLVLTKRDELKVSEREPALEAARAALAKRPAAYPEIAFTSAQEGEGLEELRAGIARLLAGR